MQNSDEKTVFLQNIKSWVEHSSKIDILNQKIKEEKKELDTLTPKITTYMATNNMTNTVINIPDGKLKYVESTTQSSITLKLLQDSLIEYFNGDIDKASECFNFIKNKRQTKTTVDIKRTYN